MPSSRHRLRDPVVLALAVVALLSLGTAAAERLITGKDIKNHSITGKDIKRKSLPLSVFRATPVGLPGRAGDAGPQGEAGIDGADGEAGPPGASAITDVYTLHSPIAASIPTGTALAFVGQPADVTAFVGDQGVIDATVTVGTSGATIDDEEKFRITICVKEGTDPLFPLDAPEAEDFGVSPVIAQDDRVAVSVSAAFEVVGDPGEASQGQIGPCVLNETGSPLDDNNRAMGYILVSGV